MEPGMPPELQTLRLPVRGGSCHLWVGHHRPAAATALLPMASLPMASLPLVVCHGGPGIPSDYLFPLVEHLQRPLIFYDQLGCGRSDRPEPDGQNYSIATSIDDLVELIEALVSSGWIPMAEGRPAYHLYGQSFGGILAFEALTAAAGPAQPRSLTLSNVPSSVPCLLEDVAALLAALGGDGARFDATHVCRATPRPAALVAAYAPGQPGSHWRGVDVIADWSASERGLAQLQTPVLLLTAEHDFVSLRSMEGWRKLSHQRLVTIPDAAHHALLERPDVYGAHLEGFLREHEESVADFGQQSDDRLGAPLPLDPAS